MMYYNSVDELEDLLVEEITHSGTKAHLIVFNDDHNTFEWVIEAFKEVLNHSQEQSEQLSLIIHFKGKATVKTDVKEHLKPLKTALIDRGLSAVIEEFQEK